nr:SAM-dependent methyltransferase [Gammaproteobacteria bacterium]
VIPQFYRSLEEFRAPLEDPTSRAYQAGLRLESAEIRYVRCPYAAHFERQGDVDAFASSYVPTTRTWSEAAFANSLDSKRSAEERAAIVGEFFDSFVEHVRSDPAGHGMDYVHAYISVRKI